MSEILSFEDEAQAYAEIEAMGYHAMAFDIPAEDNDLHWHDFESVLPQRHENCCDRGCSPSRADAGVRRDYRFFGAT